MPWDHHGSLFSHSLLQAPPEKDCLSITIDLLKIAAEKNKTVNELYK